MKKKRRMIKRIFFPLVLSVLFVAFVFGSAAVTTPWIEVPTSEEIDESGEISDDPRETESPGEGSSESGEPASTEPLGEKETTAGEAGSFEIGTDPTDGSETTAGYGTETSSKGVARVPKKKGCGSTIPQSGVGFAISMIGIAEIFCLKRKEQCDGSAN